MANIYYDKDSDLSLILDKTVAVIGFGNQGEAQAMNMRDNGLKDIIVACQKDSTYERAVQAGFEAMPVKDAAKRADIIFMLIPDEVAPEVFENEIRPYLKKNVIINFASAYNITFKKIIPPADADVVMAAPRMIGKGVREFFESGEGFPAFVGVAQDASGKALEYAKALCKAIGSTKKGAIEVDFDDETMLDLMSEQAVWPIIYTVFMETFKIEAAHGHPEEAILMEMYMSKEPEEMMKKAAEIGMFKQIKYHSHTSQYGQLTSFDEFDATAIHDYIEKRYNRIRSGEFAEEWDKEQKEYHLANLEKYVDEAVHNVISEEETKLHERLKS